MKRNRNISVSTRKDTAILIRGSRQRDEDKYHITVPVAREKLPRSSKQKDCPCVPPKNRCFVANCTSLRILHVRWFVCWMRLQSPPRFLVITVPRIPAYGVSGARTNATPETRAEQSWKETAGLIDKYGPKPKLTMRRMPMSTIPLYRPVRVTSN